MTRASLMLFPPAPRSGVLLILLSLSIVICRNGAAAERVLSTSSITFTGETIAEDVRVTADVSSVTLTRSQVLGKWSFDERPVGSNSVTIAASLSNISGFRIQSSWPFLKITADSSDISDVEYTVTSTDAQQTEMRQTTPDYRFATTIFNMVAVRRGTLRHARVVVQGFVIPVQGGMFSSSSTLLHNVSLDLSNSVVAMLHDSSRPSVFGMSESTYDGPSRTSPLVTIDIHNVTIVYETEGRSGGIMLLEVDAMLFRASNIVMTINNSNVQMQPQNSIERVFVGGGAGYPEQSVAFSPQRRVIIDFTNLAVANMHVWPPLAIRDVPLPYLRSNTMESTTISTTARPDLDIRYTDAYGRSTSPKVFIEKLVPRPYQSLVTGQLDLGPEYVWVEIDNATFSTLTLSSHGYPRVEAILLSAMHLTAEWHPTQEATVPTLNFQSRLEFERSVFETLAVNVSGVRLDSSSTSMALVALSHCTLSRTTVAIRDSSLRTYGGWLVKLSYTNPRLLDPSQNTIEIINSSMMMDVASNSGVLQHYQSGGVHWRLQNVSVGVRRDARNATSAHGWTAIFASVDVLAPKTWPLEVDTGNNRATTFGFEIGGLVTFFKRANVSDLQCRLAGNARLELQDSNLLPGASCDVRPLPPFSTPHMPRLQLEVVRGILHAGSQLSLRTSAEWPGRRQVVAAYNRGNPTEPPLDHWSSSEILRSEVVLSNVRMPSPTHDANSRVQTDDGTRFDVEHAMPLSVTISNSALRNVFIDISDPDAPLQHARAESCNFEVTSSVFNDSRITMRDMHVPTRVDGTRRRLMSVSGTSMIFSRTTVTLLNVSASHGTSIGQLLYVTALQMDSASDLVLDRIRLFVGFHDRNQRSSAVYYQCTSCRVLLRDVRCDYVGAHGSGVALVIDTLRAQDDGRFIVTVGPSLQVEQAIIVGDFLVWRADEIDILYGTARSSSDGADGASKQPVWVLNGNTSVDIQQMTHSGQVFIQQRSLPFDVQVSARRPSVADVTIRLGGYYAEPDSTSHLYSGAIAPGPDYMPRVAARLMNMTDDAFVFTQSSVSFGATADDVTIIAQDVDESRNVEVINRMAGAKTQVVVDRTCLRFELTQSLTYNQNSSMMLGLLGHEFSRCGVADRKLLRAESRLPPDFVAVIGNSNVSISSDGLLDLRLHSTTADFDAPSAVCLHDTTAAMSPDARPTVNAVDGGSESLALVNSTVVLGEQHAMTAGCGLVLANASRLLGSSATQVIRLGECRETLLASRDSTLTRGVSFPWNAAVEMRLADVCSSPASATVLTREELLRPPPPTGTFDSQAGSTFTVRRADDCGPFPADAAAVLAKCDGGRARAERLLATVNEWAPPYTPTTLPTETRSKTASHHVESIASITRGPRVTTTVTPMDDEDVSTDAPPATTTAAPVTTDVNSTAPPAPPNTTEAATPDVAHGTLSASQPVRDAASSATVPQHEQQQADWSATATLEISVERRPPRRREAPATVSMALAPEVAGPASVVSAAVFGFVSPSAASKPVAVRRIAGAGYACAEGSPDVDEFPSLYQGFPTFFAIDGNADGDAVSDDGGGDGDSDAATLRETVSVAAGAAVAGLALVVAGVAFAVAAGSQSASASETDTGAARHTVGTLVQVAAGFIVVIFALLVPSAFETAAFVAAAGSGATSTQMVAALAVLGLGLLGTIALWPFSRVHEADVMSKRAPRGSAANDVGVIKRSLVVVLAPIQDGLVDSRQVSHRLAFAADATVAALLAGFSGALRSGAALWCTWLPVLPPTAAWALVAYLASSRPFEDRVEFVVAVALAVLQAILATLSSMLALGVGGSARSSMGETVEHFAGWYEIVAIAAPVMLAARSMVQACRRTPGGAGSHEGQHFVSGSTHDAPLLVMPGEDDPGDGHNGGEQAAAKPTPNRAQHAEAGDAPKVISSGSGGLIGSAEHERAHHQRGEQRDAPRRAKHNPLAARR